MRRVPSIAALAGRMGHNNNCSAAVSVGVALSFLCRTTTTTAVSLAAVGSGWGFGANTLCTNVRHCTTTDATGGAAATKRISKMRPQRLRKKATKRSESSRRPDGASNNALEAEPMVAAEPSSEEGASAAEVGEAPLNDGRRTQEGRRVSEAMQAPDRSAGSTEGRKEEVHHHTPSPPRRGNFSSGGWAYDDVDASSGKTGLEERFDRSAERVRELFDQPIPDLPSDGNARPHFLLGFAHYNHRLRDQYRLVVASMLGVHPRNVTLSIGWSGRFDVARFGNCQKVCGVRIAEDKENNRRGSDDGSPTDGSGHHRSKDSAAGGDTLSAALADAVNALVALAQRRKDERLLGLHIINGAMPVSEIRFTERNRRVDAFVQFVQRTILSCHQVVILHTNAPRDLALIEGRWMQLFIGRKVIPHVASTDDVLQAWAASDASQATATTTGDAVQQHTQNDGNAGGTQPHQQQRQGGGSGAADAPPPRLDGHALMQAAVTKLASGGVGRFPMVFCNGVHVGSTAQMQYLTKHQQALNAILLHPNDIGFAKKFMNQLSPGDKRRETLLRDATDMHSGRVQS